MARAARVVVQVERLRDQVYQLIREDIRSGEFEPGQRLVEVDLAEKYGVSRTPVREALFQLARSGFLDSSERSYSVPIYSKKDVIDRLEVKQLLIPALVAHVAKTATALQVKRLARLHEQEKSAHAAASVGRFVEANQEFRHEYYGICENKLLSRCLAMVEDQFEIARSRIHQLEENRRLSIEHDGRLLAAIAAHDADAAVAEVAAFLQFLDSYYDEHASGAGAD
jgi:DNA-binding GntR family transcriptional regulator